MTQAHCSWAAKNRRALVMNGEALHVGDAERLMVHVTGLRAASIIPDAIILLRHPCSVALGLKDQRSPHPKDLLVSPERLEAEGIALVSSIRGGGITYHWPGQVVCYPILRLGPSERDIPAYMRKLEEVCIRTLSKFGIEAYRRRDTPAHIGLWAKGRKIVSMGVRVSNWITSFGFALNLEGDYTPSRYIRPCGIEGACLTTIEETLGAAPRRAAVVEVVKESFSIVFERTLEPMTPELEHWIHSPGIPVEPKLTRAR